LLDFKLSELFGEFYHGVHIFRDLWFFAGELTRGLPSHELGVSAKRDFLSAESPQQFQAMNGCFVFRDIV